VYEEAQEILEGKDGPFKEELHTLNRLAKLLKEKRFKEGSVNFDTKEVRFKLDENSKPIGIYVKERKDAHMLVEDFMLLANKHVAQYAGKEMNANGKVPFVYRVHDYPNEEKLMDFTLFALKFGYKMQWDTPQQISRELNKLMLQLEGKPEQNLLEGLAIRCMAKAVYTTKNIGHYGLGFEFYTHFTSPIRRYPDVMVHRILDKIIHKQSLPSEGILESQCKHSSERERAAADAERASVKYKMAEYMYNHVGEVFTGVISGVKSWGVYVELPAYNCEGMIKMEAFDDDRYIVDEKKMEVRGIFNNKKFSLGDVIKVKLEGVDMEKKTIDFILP
jgi:ribonuclease R